MSDITPTDEQFNAINAIKKWYNTPSERKFPFILAGYAGTGKTSIAKHIIQDLAIKSYQVRYCAYTGKAALVMNKKGMPATTIHSLIYEPRKDKDGKVYFEKKYSLGTDVKLICVDESSMIGKKLQTDLESFGIPIIYIGDHGQLNPVSEDMTNLMLNPNFRLETILRQSLENPIIWVAAQARKGKFIKFGKYGSNVLKCPAEKVGIESLKRANQILCGKNITRKTINDQMRDYYGFKSIFPEPDDKLICLKNNSRNGLVNGMIGKCLAFDEKTYKLDFETDEEDLYEGLPIDYNIFRGVKNEKYMKGIESFDFSYAITTHKAQGSEWENVIVYQELMGWDTDNHNRWLYTSFTRASQRLIIIA